MPMTLLTDLAVSKLRTAAGSGSQVAITHIALGDGLGAAYDPTNNQTALRRERVRKAIERRSALGNDSWRVTTSFPPETAAFDVREIGFFDSAGTLIAIFAGRDIDARRTGVITYLIDHVLHFSRVQNGLMIVDAPDDELFDFAVIQLAHQARQDRILLEIGA